MAKKKNAPVLRSGNEPETKTITKSYAVRDKWLDKAKDNLVEFKSVDGEISDLKVNGEPAGGGGGGGLAEVTIINNTANEIDVNMIYVDTNQPPIIGSRFVSGIYVDGSSSMTVQAPTTGDYNKAQGVECTITAVSGDIELNSTTHIAIIKGTGTITVS
jgi:hypothetical protein